MRKFIEFLHGDGCGCGCGDHEEAEVVTLEFDNDEKIDREIIGILDRKSTRLNSSHLLISYAVFCLKKKTPDCL